MLLAVGFHERTNVVFVSKKQIHKDYAEKMRSECLPFVCDHEIQTGFLNEPMHTSNNYKKGFF